ncbi:MAG TPA: MerR family transcriptional regulator [Pseudonocardia sp.]|jgi:DNA-binding transcriptional MerR regulator|nr:MerR family transcriptional regulator [Pseudonocardia sp.]
MPDDELHSIGAVASAFDVPVSTLRYYDEIGLVSASHRRSQVRHYDRKALERLAYVQLWRLDGMLSIDHTTELIASTNREQRNELLQRSRDELADRIRRLGEAHDMLAHMMRCPYDDHEACPVISTYLTDRVDAALLPEADGPRPQPETANRTLQRLAESLLGAQHGTG